MQSSLKYIFVFGALSIFLLAGIAAFNYVVDPLCFYHCHEIELGRPTQNLYYQAAQTAKAHPDAEALILGSSRGETTPPQWVAEATGLKAINLSQGGADLLLKLVLAKVAIQSAPGVKKIIWMSDFFELIRQTTDIKVRNTLAFKKFLPESEKQVDLVSKMHSYQRLIDHNNFEASIAALGGEKRDSKSLGTGSEIDYQECLSPSFKGSTNPDLLPKEVLLLFENYRSSVFKNPQDEAYWKIFEEQMTDWSKEGIEVVFVFTPYHPEFLRKLKTDLPDVYEAHQNWIKKVNALSLKGLLVLNYFEGIPGDDGSPTYWNDGVHFSCRGAIEMLKPTLSGSKQP